jgi:hypothetical protein
MNTKRLAGIVILFLIFIMGCSGASGKLKTQSESESKVTQQELIDNWSDYNIRYNSVVIVFDPKNDDKKIIVDNYWSMVKDQEAWTQLVNGTKTLPNRSINQVWGNEIREIWIPDNQFYGYVTHQPNELVSAQIVDENTVRLIHNFAVYGGP